MGKLKSRSRAAPAPLFQTHNPNNQTKKNKHTHNFPKTHKTPRKKKGGGEPRSCEQTHPSSEEFLTYFSKPKNHILKLNQQSSSPITIITLLGVTQNTTNSKGSKQNPNVPHGNC